MQGLNYRNYFHISSSFLQLIGALKSCLMCNYLSFLYLLPLESIVNEHWCLLNLFITRVALHLIASRHTICIDCLFYPTFCLFFSKKTNIRINWNGQCILGVSMQISKYMGWSNQTATLNLRRILSCFDHKPCLFSAEVAIFASTERVCFE